MGDQARLNCARAELAPHERPPTTPRPHSTKQHLRLSHPGDPIVIVGAVAVVAYGSVAQTKMIVAVGHGSILTKISFQRELLVGVCSSRRGEARELSADPVTHKTKKRITAVEHYRTTAVKTISGQPLSQLKKRTTAVKWPMGP